MPASRLHEDSLVVHQVIRLRAGTIFEERSAGILEVGRSRHGSGQMQATAQLDRLFYQHEFGHVADHLLIQARHADITGGCRQDFGRIWHRTQPGGHRRSWPASFAAHRPDRRCGRNGRG